MESVKGDVCEDNLLKFSIRRKKIWVAAQSVFASFEFRLATATDLRPMLRKESRIIGRITFGILTESIVGSC
jgi:hypothetical protein